MSLPKELQGLTKLPLKVLIHIIKQLKCLIKTLGNRNLYQAISDQILDNPATLDSVLYFICYNTLLLSSILNNRKYVLNFLHMIKLRVVIALKKLFALDASKESQLLISRKTTSPTEESPSNLSVNLKTLSSYLSDVRIFNRMWALIPLVPWTVDELHKEYPSLPSRLLNYFQVFNVVGMQLFENIGFVADHNFATFKDNDRVCIDYYIYSSVLWGFYILIEAYHLLKVPMAARDGKWYVGMYKHITNLPLAVHWGLEAGCLSSFWVAMCAGTNSFFAMRDIMADVSKSL